MVSRTTLSLNEESEYSLIHFCLLGKHRVPTIPPGIVSNLFSIFPLPPLPHWGNAIPPLPQFKQGTPNILMKRWK